MKTEPTTAPATGIKYDGQKPDYSLLPPNALDDVARVLTYGAKKYDRENWRKLDDLQNRYFAAAQRHLWAIRKGERLDPETGLHHAAHAIASLMFIIEDEYEQSIKANPPKTAEREHTAQSNFPENTIAEFLQIPGNSFVTNDSGVYSAGRGGRSTAFRHAGTLLDPNHPSFRLAQGSDSWNRASEREVVEETPNLHFT